MTSDPSPFDPAERAFRRYLVARRAGDERVAGEAWFELIRLHLDRVKVWVAAFDFGGLGQRIPLSDRDDAVQEAVLRATDMLATWEGAHLNQWRKALRTATWNACADRTRRRITRERREAGSFDEPAYADDDGSGAGRFDHDVADSWWADDADHELDVRAAFKRLVEGIGDLPNPNHRVVLMMTMDGGQSKAIAEHLGTTPNNVDVMRKRAIKALGDHYDQAT